MSAHSINSSALGPNEGKRMVADRRAAGGRPFGLGIAKVERLETSVDAEVFASPQADSPALMVKVGGSAEKEVVTRTAACAPHVGGVEVQAFRDDLESGVERDDLADGRGGLRLHEDFCSPSRRGKYY